MTSPLGKLAFLVVDDNANMVQIVKTILKNFGVIHVYEAKDVAEAFGLVRQFAIDIVLLDYNLGFMDGIEFVKLMRTATDSPNPYLPVIMLTAYTEQHRVTAARDAGVTEFCAKPVTAIEIYRKIAEVIERPRSFVRTATYFGPERRRHDIEFKGPERRRDRMAQAPAETGALEAKAG
ncbi:MAG TPA: response regulator [Caulobacteraceae bacterium]|nr:response regulator [Caulobacteraceae bacterium]